MSNEIKETRAHHLQPHDAETLIRWRNWQEEWLVEGFTMQGLLKLYHASGEYFTIADWLADDPTAQAQYDRINRSLHGGKKNQGN